MTDQQPTVVNIRDDGEQSVFTVSGSVGVSPNRPVAVTGNMRVQQILLVANEFAGCVMYSGSEGEKITVVRNKIFKSYVTGTVTSGDFLVATGTSVAASFKTVAAAAAVSGSTYISLAMGLFRIAGQALQNGTDGDQILIKLF